MTTRTLTANGHDMFFGLVNVSIPIPIIVYVMQKVKCGAIMMTKAESVRYRLNLELREVRDFRYRLSMSQVMKYMDDYMDFMDCVNDKGKNIIACMNRPFP